MNMKIGIIRHKNLSTDNYRTIANLKHFETEVKFMFPKYGKV